MDAWSSRAACRRCRPGAVRRRSPVSSSRTLAVRRTDPSRSARPSGPPARSTPRRSLSPNRGPVEARDAGDRVPAEAREVPVRSVVAPVPVAGGHLRDPLVCSLHAGHGRESMGPGACRRRHEGRSPPPSPPVDLSSRSRVVRTARRPASPDRRPPPPPRVASRRDRCARLPDRVAPPAHRGARRHDRAARSRLRIKDLQDLRAAGRRGVARRQDRVGRSHLRVGRSPLRVGRSQLRGGRSQLRGARLEDRGAPCPERPRSARGKRR